MSKLILDPESFFSNNDKIRMTSIQRKSFIDALNYFLLKSAKGIPASDGIKLIIELESYFGVVNSSYLVKIEDLLEILKSLSDSRKKWLIEIIINVVLTNGEISDSISEEILTFTIDLGFSLDDAYEIIMSHPSEYNLLLPKERSNLEYEDSFTNQLTNQQKKSILGCFMLLISTTENEDYREMNYLQKITSLLGVDVTSHYFSTLLNEDELIQVLNTLPKPKKEWLLFSLHLLVVIKGSPDLDKVPLLIGIAGDMGFSQYELRDVVQKFEGRL